MKVLLPCPCFSSGLLLLAPPRAQLDAPARAQGFLDQFPWLGDFITAILGVALLCLLVYFLRPGAAAGADFSIHLDGEEIIFKGRFPHAAQALVTDFLLHDCQIAGPCVITGKWQDDRLAVAVHGDSARPAEQRIRNFLKLNVKR